MSDKEVARFMVGMAMNAGALKRFHADPEAEMSRFGVSADAQQVIKSKDAVAIHRAIKENFSVGAADDVVNIVVVVLP
jgi:hypothetical protein